MSSSKVKKEGFVDAKYSSGDNNQMISDKSCKEENNNEVDVLSEELQMGCIVDGVKRPPNICVETCVYEEDSDPEECSSNNDAIEEEADPYSDDDFEQASDGEDSNSQLDAKSAKSEMDNRLGLALDQAQFPQSSVKLSKSHSFMRKSNGSLAGKSTVSSSKFSGSQFVPKTRRVNMSFTNDRLREIERHNHILLNKILSARNVKKSSIPAMAPELKRQQPPAAFNRKKQQRQIDHENMILLRRIQRAKSTSCSIRR